MPYEIESKPLPQSTTCASLSSTETDLEETKVVLQHHSNP